MDDRDIALTTRLSCVLYRVFRVSICRAVEFNFGDRPFRYNLLSRDWEDDETVQLR